MGQTFKLKIMSRYTKQLEEKDYTIAYGFDHASGYFFQVFDNNPEDEDDDIILNECSIFTGMSNGDMIDLMTKYKVDDNHIAQVMLDLPF